MLRQNGNAKSPLLIFAVTGRIGSGCSFVSDSLAHALASYGYSTRTVKIAEILADGDEEFSSEGDRIRKLQERGSALRKERGEAALAEECLRKDIVSDIQTHHLCSERHAYIIDSLKHPNEIDFLRQLFQQSFYLIGVVASDEKREERLDQRKGLSEEEIRELSTIDAGKTSEGTQETVKTVTLADYFFKNDYTTRNDMNAEADRLMRRIFDVGVDTPREDEYGMHIAYQASLRSACLSRQVGAAIFSNDGTLLSTGHNDVPKYGGGLYGMEPGHNLRQAKDKRCWAFGAKCYNDIEKRLLAEKVSDDLIEADLLTKERRDDAIKAILNARVDQLIEFSRAVHAEMEAIISIARTASNGLVGSTLYSTTYPCHNCAKHIIDAGITRVVYREPYEKSLARKLHRDVIRDTSVRNELQVITFENYGGVGPQRFEEFFRRRQKRKHEDGTYIDRDRNRTTQLPSGAMDVDVWSKRLKKFLPRDLIQVVNSAKNSENAAVQRASQ